MKNKITVFGGKGIFFQCAIALAVFGLTLTGCPVDEDSSFARWPAEFVREVEIEDNPVGQWVPTPPTSTSGLIDLFSYPNSGEFDILLYQRESYGLRALDLDDKKFTVQKLSGGKFVGDPITVAYNYSKDSYGEVLILLSTNFPAFNGTFKPIE